MGCLNSRSGCAAISPPEAFSLKTHLREDSLSMGYRGIDKKRNMLDYIGSGYAGVGTAEAPCKILRSVCADYGISGN